VQRNAEPQELNDNIWIKETVPGIKEARAMEEATCQGKPEPLRRTWVPSFEALGMLQSQVCLTCCKACVLAKGRPAFEGPLDCWESRNSSSSPQPAPCCTPGLLKEEAEQDHVLFWAWLPGSSPWCASWRPLVQVSEELEGTRLLMGRQKCSASVLCIYRAAEHFVL